ncbi:MAG: T9SS C-terminal target domain-containing protein, partial [Candidatus Zixiibacteriota bacterium]
GGAASNRWTAVSASSVTGYITATYSGQTDSTGLVSVDATKPGTVTGFNIVTFAEDSNFVNAYWSNTSSYDDGTSAASGNVADFDVRFATAAITSEAAWNAATSVGTTNKPTSFNGSSVWHIYMSPFGAGNYYYAIKTMDAQGNWSVIGAGCYTNQPDYSLPVTLSTFSAAPGYGKITLTWATESEVDALGFRVQRDVDPDFPGPVTVADYESDPTLLCQGSGETGAQYQFVDRTELEPDVTYYYRLEMVDVNGYAEISALTASTVILALPADLSLGQNYPNPFNPVTHVQVSLPRDTEATVTVFDVRGREVARLADGLWLEAGVHTLSWDGSALPSGLYFCRLQAGGAVRTIKMMLVK